MSQPQFLETLGTELKRSARACRREPLVTIAIIALLAFGIGFDTVVFSVLNRVLITPLPYNNPNQLMRLWTTNPGRNIPETGVSAPDFKDWERNQRSFSQLGAWELSSFNLTGSGEPVRLAAVNISTDFTSLLGIAPIIGRGFLPEEGISGRNHTALIGYGLWESQFGGDPTVVGRQLDLNDEPYMIAGVMPPGFGFPGNRELWVPLVLDPTTQPWRADRTNRSLSVFGRLRSSVTMSQAVSDLNILAQQLQTAYPETNSGWRIRLLSFADWLVPAQLRRSLLVLSAAVGLLLLLACANAANLLLARYVARKHDFAVRAALGATRTRLIGTSLVTSVFLAFLGGASGLFLAETAVALIRSHGVQGIPFPSDIRIDVNVMLFCVGICLITGVVCGAAPAWWSSRAALTEELRKGDRTTGDKASYILGDSLVIVQVALATCVLISAGLLVRSFVGLQSLHLGFNPEHVLTMQINLPSSRYPLSKERTHFFDQLLQNIRTTPGVVDASTTTDPPDSADDWNVIVTLPEFSKDLSLRTLSAHAYAVNAHYFRSLGIPLIQGTDFNEPYDNNAALQLIVSKSFADRCWPNEDPIGKQFRPGPNAPTGQVVGVVGDVRSEIEEDPQPAFYFPYQYPAMSAVVLIVRTSVAPETLIMAVRTQISALDSKLPIYNIRTMTQVVSGSLAQARFQAVLSSIFGVASMLLAVLGVYSLNYYFVKQKQRELAIRIAMGAEHIELITRIIKRGLIRTSMGLAIGILAAAISGRWLRALLYGIGTDDLLTFTLVPISLLLAGAIASYIAARAATTVDPSMILRNE